MSKIQHIALVLLVGSNIAFAQQILILNGGTQIHGRYDGGKADTISFIDEHGNRHKFNISEIQSLIFNPAPPPPSAFGSNGPNTSVPTYRERGYADTDVAPSAGWTRSATLPPGTEIVVRTIDPIYVRQPDPDRHFLATVDRDVLDSNGNVAIPRGSPAHLIAHRVGNGEVAIDLRSVSVNGRRYLLNSENITNAKLKQGLGTNKRTGAFVGGGALLGTVLGAVAGGGKGAAIGAFAGAGGRSADARSSAAYSTGDHSSISTRLSCLSLRMMHPGDFWRRKRDSNPRTSFPVNGFQDRRLKPLGHSSNLKVADQRAAGKDNMTGRVATAFRECLSAHRLGRLARCSQDSLLARQ